MAREVKDITFSEISALVKAQGDPALVDGLDRLLGAVIVLSPLVTGTTATWKLLGPKNELAKIGKQLVKKLTGKRDESFLDHHRRMAAAHCLLCYTAFFDATAQEMKVFGRNLALDVTEKAGIADVALSKLRLEGRADAELDAAAVAVRGEAVALPHPVFDFSVKKAQLRLLYGELTQGVRHFITGLAEWDEAGDAIRGRLEERLEGLRDRALAEYEAQYFQLAARHAEFFVWANLQSQETLDIGLTRLEQTVRELPAAILQDRARRITENLRSRDIAAIEEQVITDLFDDAGPALHYPRKCDIFVPQAFRALYFRGAGGAHPRLEDEAAWDGLEPRDDLAPFILSYLSSPYSVEAPLVILGHPGSGKSLLTEMLAARLAVSAFNPIRIELRDIDADADVRTELARQVYRRAGYELTWGELLDELSGSPPLVILDGFDELLQASGKAHTHYLDRVHAFQREALALGKPLRVVITSRITLIDKAKLPVGTTVIRLEEFDPPRRERWIETWNAGNTGFFREQGLREFAIPANPRIEELSHQPLLLLMLAVFDSQGNQLHEHRELDQTLLYDRLLRRFILRERTKGEAAHDFRALSEDEQRAEFDTDMRRLGVAALSMFNRRSLHIHEAELERDVEHLGLGRPVSEAGGTTQPQARLLLGSFFFVHESRSRVHRGAEEGREPSGPAAFEFLHNTFGEFLTADFIVAHVLEQARAVAAMRGSSALAAPLEQMLGERDGLVDAWYLALGYTPLYTRPVILRMLREWARHRLEPELLESAETIVRRQLAQLLDGSVPPSSILTAERPTPYEPLPLLGHYAVYSINLVLLLAALRKEGFTIEREAWDRLTQLWRSWSPLDDLVALADVMQTLHAKQIVIVYLPDGASDVRATGAGIERVLAVATALADDLLTGLAELHAYDVVPETDVDLGRVKDRLAAAGVDLDVAIALRAMEDDGWRASKALAPLSSVDGRSRAGRRLLGLLASPDAPMGTSAGGVSGLHVGLSSFVDAAHARDLVRGWASFDPSWLEFAVRETRAGGSIHRLFATNPGAAAHVVRLLAGELPAEQLAEMLSAGDDADAGHFALGAAIIDCGQPMPPEHRRALLGELLSRHSPIVLASAPPEAVRSLFEAAEVHGGREDLARWLNEEGPQDLADAQPFDVVMDMIRIAGWEEDPPRQRPAVWGLEEARANLQFLLESPRPSADFVHDAAWRRVDTLPLRALKRSTALRSLIDWDQLASLEAAPTSRERPLKG